MLPRRQDRLLFPAVPQVPHNSGCRRKSPVSACRKAKHSSRPNSILRATQLSILYNGQWLRHDDFPDSSIQHQKLQGNGADRLLATVLYPNTLLPFRTACCACDDSAHNIRLIRTASPQKASEFAFKHYDGFRNCWQPGRNDRNWAALERQLFNEKPAWPPSRRRINLTHLAHSSASGIITSRLTSPVLFLNCSVFVPRTGH
jgi:hypothetical protein